MTVKMPTKGEYKKKLKEFEKESKKLSVCEIVDTLKDLVDEFGQIPLQMQTNSLIITKKFDKIPTPKEAKEHKDKVKVAEMENDKLTLRYYEIQPKIESYGKQLEKKAGMKINPNNIYSVMSFLLKQKKWCYEKKINANGGWLGLFKMQRKTPKHLVFS